MQNAMPRIELGRPATYDDLVALPDHLVAEIVDDELWASPRPAPRHTEVHTALVAGIRSAFGRGPEGPGGWVILLEPELHFARNVVVPDLAGWRRERMPALPETAYFTVAPDWICEVLSPSTAMLDRAKKLRVYAEAGVEYAWLVDPIVRTLEVLQCHDHRWTLVDAHSADDVVHAVPFEALGLPLSSIWGDL